MKFRLLAALFNIALIPVSGFAIANQVSRTALVIGNADYTFSALINPLNDAKDMAEALRLLDFDVIERTNVDKKGMRQAIREFGAKLKDNGGVGFFYFAGHGMQIGGNNYLLPTDLAAKAAYEVEEDAVSANIVLRAMEAANNSINIVVLDACRNNPFAGKFRSMTRGLSRMEGPSGSFMAFATAPGSVAADGNDSNGLYTKYLLQYMMKPGLPLESVFKKVRIAVEKETKGRQVPWESSSLKGDFYFIEKKQQKAEAFIAESAVWDQLKSTSNPADLQKFIASYSSSVYVPAAKLRLDQLTRPRITGKPTNLAGNESDAQKKIDQAYALLFQDNGANKVDIAQVTQLYRDAAALSPKKSELFRLRKELLSRYLQTAKKVSQSGKQPKDKIDALNHLYADTENIASGSVEAQQVNNMLVLAYIDMINLQVDNNNIELAQHFLNSAMQLQSGNARLLELKQLVEKYSDSNYNNFVPVM